MALALLALAACTTIITAMHLPSTIINALAAQDRDEAGRHAATAILTAAACTTSAAATHTLATWL